MGMTYEEYWEKDPWMCRDYRKAHDIKQDEFNTNAWLQGLYHFVAVQTALANAFKEKGKPTVKYLEKPIDLHEKEKTVQEIRQEAYEKLKRLKEVWDGRHKNGDDTPSN